MKMLSSLLIASTLSGCATVDRKQQIQEYPVSQLKVDNVNSRTYVGNVEEALEKMMDESLSSREEDAWLSYRGYDGRTYFVDVGKRAYKSETNVGIEPDREKLYRTLSTIPEGSDATLYHIHPLHSKDADLLGLDNMVKATAIPSANDYLGDAQLRIVLRTNQTRANLTQQRVVGPAGYTEFSTSEKDLDLPVIENPKDAESMDSLSWRVGVSHMVPYLNMAFNQSPDRVEQCLREFNERGLKAKYTRLRDTPKSLKIKAKAVK